MRVVRCPLPVGAAVNGPAVGAGLNLALACDVRLASETASFDSRFPALRLHPGGGHTWLLEQAVGRQRATVMALFGQPMTAPQAEAAGLVLEVCAGDELVDRAVELASGVDGMEAEFVTTVIDTLRASAQMSRHDEAFALESERQRASTLRPEFVRSTQALLRRISSR